MRNQNGHEHLFVIKGKVNSFRDNPLKIHSVYVTGGGLHSFGRDCDQQLSTVLNCFESLGVGGLIHLRQKVGLFNKVGSCALQYGGLDTVKATTKPDFSIKFKSLEIDFWMIRRLGIELSRFLTNQPKKSFALRNNGTIFTGFGPLQVFDNKFNRRYFQTIEQKLAHLL
jgi:GTP cyclohydrolase II